LNITQLATPVMIHAAQLSIIVGFPFPLPDVKTSPNELSAGGMGLDSGYNKTAPVTAMINTIIGELIVWSPFFLFVAYC